MSLRAPYISDIRVNSFTPTPGMSSCLVAILLEPFRVLVFSLGMLYGISLFSRYVIMMTVLEHMG